MPKIVKLNPKAKFGRLKVLQEVRPKINPNGRSSRRFLCLCDCGKKKDVLMQSLRSGHTQSCGCVQREKVSSANIVHGLSKHPLYDILHSRIDCCYNKDNQAYHNYGGRGIKVCRAWRSKKGLKNFIAWAESLPSKKQWKPGLQLDRIDNNGNYSPENCHFTTAKKNSRNRRNNIWVIFNGKKMLLIQAWEKYGNPNTRYDTARQRYQTYGWPVEEAIQ